MEATLENLKECRRNTPKHVKLADLPSEDRFRQLGMKSKYFIDIVKMIAYRTETAMANILHRSLLRSLYGTETDLLPDYDKGSLTVCLHQPANNYSAETIKKLCRELNKARVKFPGTELHLVYDLVS